jgi:hypothetical protein
VLALTGRRRPGAVAAGVLLAAGSLLTRFAVFRAGFESAADPVATIEPQRSRGRGSATGAGMDAER